MCPKHPNLKNFEVLEAGCGLGSGLQWVQSAHPEVKSVAGIDRVVRNSLNGLITYSDVHDMQCASNSFNLVLNVESSHCYADIKKFLQEVERVLKPGGYFCWADIAYSKENHNNQYIFSTLSHFLKIEDILKYAEKANLELVSYEDITESVLDGIDKTAKRYDWMADQSPWFIRIFKVFFRYFYCAPNTEAYSFLQNGDMVYAAACWKKRES
uniref:Methyltransferase type 11 domain-containing protein n=1 Tax=Acrobeloides nanus TaxID=290746 RepID=A0A914EGF2_9BILA